MTAMRSISKLTTSVDQLTGAANMTKAELDAKVAAAQSEVPAVQVEQSATEAARDAAGTHATEAETHLATVKAGVTYAGIDAILAAKAVTAVDLFVYDTSLDSDGGAWRKRCQHTSWFNEPLNTATRGARREFPAVAVIIAEVNRLTIYDADDPVLPMWMAFDTDNPSMLASSTAPTLTSIVMRDGEMVVGSGYVYGGVSRIQLPADTAYRHRSIPSTNNTQGKWMLGGIADRHQNGGFNDDPDDAARIVNEKINDLAMTVLPDAPIGPTTGLPAPTIAVGTEGGTSIIKHDGVVMSDNTLSHSPSTPAMGFDADGVLWLVAAGNHMFSWAPPYIGTGASEFNDYTPGAALAQWYGWVRHVTSFLPTRPSERALAHGDGLTRFEMSRHAFTTSAYTTGWMPRSTEGVFLADTEDTDLVSGNLVTNGDFEAGGENWTPKGGATITALSEGRIEVSGGGQFYQQATQSIPVVPGQRYRFTAICDERDPQGCRLRVTDPAIGGASILLQDIRSGASAGQETISFDATAVGSNVNVALASAVDPAGTQIWSSMRVDPLDHDRSVNAYPLTVNGTITRNAVAEGADLVAYSGFSTTTKYLSQPYTPALDFGTGDFSVMAWLDRMEAWRSVVSRGLPDAVSFIIEGNGTEDTMRINIGGSRYTKSLPWFNGVWKQLALVRHSGVVSLYLDGEETDSWPAPENVSVLDAPLFIGKNTIFGSGFYPGKMALLRISATAPTPDQIAKIYEDERKLFQPGAKCTLYGASDGVTALAHDPKTNLLHVGTSDGRSVFDGLVRVDHTETPVGTAISAVNGLIVEG